MIKLELSKWNLRYYLLAAGIITITVIALVILMGFAQTREDVVFQNGTELFAIGDLLLRMSFTIFSGILLAKIIIKEYENNTIQLMFTYPISRKKIIASKLVVVAGITLLTTLLAEIVYMVVMTLLNNYLLFFVSEIDVSFLGNYMIRYIPFSVVTTMGIGLIPLYFGMKKKSAITTIVSAVILSVLLNGNIGTSSNVFSYSIVPVVLGCIGIIMAYLSYYKVDKIDI